MQSILESDGKTSLQDFFKPYFGGFDALAGAYEPMVKAMARWQLEMLTLSSRRAQAYLELPSRLAQCRTPQEIVGEQMQFLQTAYQQYSESSQRALLAVSQLGGPAASAATSEGQRQRDYMTVSEPREATAPAPRFTERERKVA